MFCVDSLVTKDTCCAILHCVTFVRRSICPRVRTDAFELGLNKISLVSIIRWYEQAPTIFEAHLCHYDLNLVNIPGGKRVLAKAVDPILLPLSLIGLTTCI